MYRNRIFHLFLALFLAGRLLGFESTDGAESLHFTLAGLGLFLTDQAVAYALLLNSDADRSSLILVLSIVQFSIYMFSMKPRSRPRRSTRRQPRVRGKESKLRLFTRSLGIVNAVVDFLLQVLEHTS